MNTKTEIINGVEITTTYDSEGNMLSQSFRPVDTKTKKKEESTSDNQSPLKTIWDWCRKIFYVKQRDLSDPFDKRNDDITDDGSGSK